MPTSSALLWIASATLALFAIPLAAQDAAPGGGWAGFTKAFDAQASGSRVVGGSAVLVRDGRIVGRHDYGFADQQRGKRVDENTLFHYGSITKTLTAIAILQLRDHGKLSLDDTVIRWLPELRQVHDPFNAIDKITVRMLLSHSAGFQAPTWPYSQGKPWEPFEPTSWEQLVAMMPYQELLFAPGSQYGYSNPAYIYLARIVEKLSGDPWQAYVQKNILSPLGLTRSYFGSTPYYLAEHRSHNYGFLPPEEGEQGNKLHDNGADFDPGITIPNSGWNAPLSDLAVYAAFLTGSTGEDSGRARLYDAVLSRSTLQEMWRPVLSRGGTEEQPEEMGLGFFILRSGQHTFIGHTGSQAGYRAFLWVNPANATAVIAVINTADWVTGANLLQPIQPAALELLR